MRLDSLDLGHFEKLYERNPDPWRFASSDYERMKYAATLEALPKERYEHALDVGCSIGVFTAALAQRCDHLLGIEPVSTALEQAKTRCASLPWVRFEAMFVPAEWPDDPFDLVVISEVLDYIGRRDLETLAERVAGGLQSGGDLVLVHWVGKKSGKQPGEEASSLFIDTLSKRFGVLRAERNSNYRLDVLRRN